MKSPLAHLLCPKLVIIIHLAPTPQVYRTQKTTQTIARLMTRAHTSKSGIGFCAPCLITGMRGKVDHSALPRDI